MSSIAAASEASPPSVTMTGLAMLRLPVTKSIAGRRGIIFPDANPATPPQAVPGPAAPRCARRAARSCQGKSDGSGYFFDMPVTCATAAGGAAARTMSMVTTPRRHRPALLRMARQGSSTIDGCKSPDAPSGVASATRAPVTSTSRIHGGASDVGQHAGRALRSYPGHGRA